MGVRRCVDPADLRRCAGGHFPAPRPAGDPCLSVCRHAARPPWRGHRHGSGHDADHRGAWHRVPDVLPRARVLPAASARHAQAGAGGRQPAGAAHLTAVFRARLVVGAEPGPGAGGVRHPGALLHRRGDQAARRAQAAPYPASPARGERAAVPGSRRGAPAGDDPHPGPARGAGQRPAGGGRLGLPQGVVCALRAAGGGEVAAAHAVFRGGARTFRRTLRTECPAGGIAGGLPDPVDGALHGARCLSGGHDAGGVPLSSSARSGHQAVSRRVDGALLHYHRHDHGLGAGGRCWPV